MNRVNLWGSAALKLLKFFNERSTISVKPLMDE